jgi:glycosyltransferase involved in cell wall biosynthesis
MIQGRQGLRVSVIIPSYNYAQFLPSAVESALAQTRAAHEIIVVDDGSTDDTPQVLARYGQRIRALQQPNQGLSAARNSGAQMASGELLAFLDSDDTWLPTKLERQVARVEADPAVGLVHCGVSEVDRAGDVIRRRLDGMEGPVAYEMLLFRRSVLMPPSTFLVPRKVFVETGGFDTQLNHSEDWDFGFRVASRHRVAFVAEALVNYRLHGGNMHRNVNNMARAMLFAYAKAFREPSSEVARLRRRAYGNLHAVLAGSFFSAGQYGPFLKHATLSLVRTPENAGRFLGYPIRWLRRRRPWQTGHGAE